MSLKETANYIVVREVRSDMIGGAEGDVKTANPNYQFAVQQVLVKENDGSKWEAIRFTYYKDGNMVARPPVFDHEVVLKTIGMAVSAGILVGLKIV